MIVRVGLDIVDIARIAQAMENPRFRERILTPEERILCTSPHRVAGRWAAKEAIAKAIGGKLKWHQVEILNDDTQAPTVAIHTKNWDPVLYRIHLSITHERGMAAAVAVLESLPRSKRPAT